MGGTIILGSGSTGRAILGGTSRSASTCTAVRAFRRPCTVGRAMRSMRSSATAERSVKIKPPSSLTSGGGPSASSSEICLIGIPDRAEGAAGRARLRVTRVPASSNTIAVACPSDAAALAKMALAAKQESVINASAAADGKIVYRVRRGLAL